MGAADTKAMKRTIPLRYFLFVCIALGAAALPWMWRQYWSKSQKEFDRQVAEIKTLKDELIQLLGVKLDDSMQVVPDEHDTTPLQASSVSLTPPPRVKEIADRLEYLTGVRPPTSFFDVNLNAPLGSVPDTPLPER